MIKLLLAASLVCSQESTIGSAYSDSYYAATTLNVEAGTHKNGSTDWNDRNQEWLDSDDDDPYPEDLRDIDGDGYRDSVDATKIN